MIDSYYGAGLTKLSGFFGQQKPVRKTDKVEQLTRFVFGQGRLDQSKPRKTSFFYRTGAVEARENRQAAIGI
jgi:hypothetical protein